MESRSKKVFWGVIIASLHIDLFGMVLLPACFGFAVLYFGIYDLEKGGLIFPLSQRQMKLYHAASAALVLISGIIGFMSIFSTLPAQEIWNLLPCILEYVVCFVLMEAYAERKPSLSGLKRGYALVMGISLIGYWLSLFVYSEVWQIFSGVTIFVCRAMILFAALNDRKITTAEACNYHTPGV